MPDIQDWTLVDIKNNNIKIIFTKIYTPLLKNSSKNKYLSKDEILIKKIIAKQELKIKKKNRKKDIIFF